MKRECACRNCEVSGTHVGEMHVSLHFEPNSDFSVLVL